MSFFSRKNKNKTKLKEKEKEKESIAAATFSSSYKVSQSTSPSLGKATTHKSQAATSPSVTVTSATPAKDKGATTSNAKPVTKTEPKAQGAVSRAVGATSASAPAPTTDKAVKKQDSNDEVFNDQITVPPGYNPKSEKANRREKSMSISKSGRHKYRGRQRSSVLEGDIFGEGSSKTLSSTGSYEGGATCRDIDQAGSSGFALAPGQPTAV